MPLQMIEYIYSRTKEKAQNPEKDVGCFDQVKRSGVVAGELDIPVSLNMVLK